MPEILADGSPSAGLVSWATFPPFPLSENPDTPAGDLEWDPQDMVRGLLSFPSADLVSAAASMFPTAKTARFASWRRLTKVSFEGERADDDREFYRRYDADGNPLGLVTDDKLRARRRVIETDREDRETEIARARAEGRAPELRDEFMTYNDLGEGSWPRIFIGPGMVKFARRDDKRAELARERASDKESAEARELRAHLSDYWNKPMALGPDWREPRPGRLVTDWSSDSKMNLRLKIASLDLAPLVSGGNLPGMVTLTLPGDWLAVAPDSKTIAAKFDRFVQAYEKKFGDLACIWKREFQKRGAPHYHLWCVPPLDAGQHMEFKRWLSKTWTRTIFRGVKGEFCNPDLHRSGKPECVDGCRLSPNHALIDGACSCSEWCRSLRAGTGVDFAEGLRARDPNRLAEYFLKESGHSEAKAYQNSAPAEWTGSIGRFWGVRKIEDASFEVAVRPADQYRLWRILRHVREHRAPLREVVLWASPNPVSGNMRQRTLTRRNKVAQIAGWVQLNDGAAFGATLGRHMAELAEGAERLCDEKSPGLAHDCAIEHRRTCIELRTGVVEII